MKINKFGKVIISEKEILITEFEFDGEEGTIEHPAMEYAEDLAMEWAIKRLETEWEKDKARRLP